MSNILKRVLYERNSPVVIKYRPVVEPVPELPQEEEISLAEVRAEAETIIAKASASAARRMADAEAEAQQLLSQAQQVGYTQGYQDGLAQGNAAALSEIKQTIQLSREKAERITAAAQQQAQLMIENAEHSIVEIALAVASKVLAREIEFDPDTILPIVKEALGKVSDQDNIVIRINSEDYEMVLSAIRELQLMVGREHAVVVTADAIVARGGCVIETASGNVDARLETKLETLHKAIQEVLP